MNFFGRNAPATGGKQEEASASRRFTLDLARAENLATMLAHSRASRVVEVADLLAGMYLYEWDRLSKYWEGDDQERIEKLLRQICQISPQRWNYWIQYYDKLRNNGEERAGLLPPLRRKLQKESAGDPPLKHSAELMSVLKQAEEIAPFHDTSGARAVPILTSECVLLCIVRRGGSDISRKLAASGLNVPQLERDATSSRRAPRS
ncbi:MAG TPA: hypothetical protein VNE63_07205 [Candidatus Acidoferrales bacterium]|nr:hypothetical protein [Candidatus Acidoferrales bacterium]